jgi:transcriptional regulator with XRE-family HTH domain
MNELPHLSEAIKCIRKRNGWSMQAFAAQLSVGHSAISRYESGKILPSKPVLQHLFALAKGVEKISISRAIGESLIAMEQKTSPKSTETKSPELLLEVSLTLTSEERQWLLRAVDIMRSSKASLLTGIIDSLHEGALLDELAKKRPSEGG